MEEENELCPYGTPLDPIEEDQVPSKKPITKEDQIAVDANGRRRFHGAFTGGFSAGYWNTVGSQEGWKPQTFKSSRQEKAGRIVQSVEDFMDSEDTGEFGIAPRRIQTQEDFTASTSGQKRKYTVAFASTTNTEGILQKLLTPARDNIGTRLLRKMGWREGQGVGVRLTRREKKQAQRQYRKEQQAARRYGCDMGPLGQESDEETSSGDSDTEITFAPDDYDSFAIAPKNNTFGLGYSGLDRNTLLQKKTSDAFAIVGKNNRKMLITGKGFGVGAMEDEDEDIYSRDDMSQYDFSLEDQKASKRVKKDNRITLGVIEGFLPASDALSAKFTCKVFRIQLPDSYQPRNFLMRKSRFTPLAPEVEKHLKQSLKSDKYALSDNQPAQEENSQTEQPETQMDAAEKQQEAPRRQTKPYRLFMHDTEKQERFEKFLEISSTSSEEVIKEFFQANQPLHLSQFDRQTEQREFLQARRMHRPLAGLMSDRFVSENSIPTEKEEEKPPEKAPEDTSTTEGPDNTGYYSKRAKAMWKPHALLCQRFNVPEPFGGLMGKEEKSKKRKSSNIFQILGDPNQQIDFTAPKVPEIPKETPPLITHSSNERKMLEIPREKAKIPPPAIKETWKDVKEAPPPINRPKNELEIAVLEAKDKHPADKKDLFRAIFEDSDESEDEIDVAVEKPTQKEDMNPLRNPAEPQGIFSKIFFVRKAAEKKREEQKTAQESTKHPEEAEKPAESVEEDISVFGPKLPPASSSFPPPRILLTASSAKDEKKQEKWVEKDELEKRKKKKEKHKKEKKHKKSKKKHKNRD